MRNDKKFENSDEQDQWIEKVVQIRRVTKVVKGGKRLSFRAVVIAGDGNGRVGVGSGKSKDVIGAIQKGVADAKKNLVNVALVKETIPHRVDVKFGAAKVLIKPASKGTGVIAGGSVRIVLEAAGVKNCTAKCLGSQSPLNNAKAAVKGLASLRTVEDVMKTRGKTAKEIVFGSV